MTVPLYCFIFFSFCVIILDCNKAGLERPQQENIINENMEFILVFIMVHPIAFFFCEISQAFVIFKILNSGAASTAY